MKFPLSPWLQHKRLVHRLAVRRFEAKRVAAGLTTRGTPRKYKIHPELRRNMGRRAYSTAYWRTVLRRRFKEMGLNSHGNAFKRGPNRVELAWRQLRASMVLNVPKDVKPDRTI